MLTGIQDGRTGSRGGEERLLGRRMVLGRVPSGDGAEGFPG